ncbi:AraC family transcriptional regulator [Pseudomonas aeruginosa]|nr:AraC family transcriptional regulator [Pseudomonas aeruginosa]
MSREPQTYLAQRFDPDALGQPALALQLEARHNDTEVPVHRHRKGQLVVACRGGITCTVPDGLWMVPAGFGVWIPGGIAHSNRVTANGKVCFLFVEPGAARLPSDCCTLALSPLVLELILHLSAQPQDYPHDGPLARLAGVLLELLEQAPTEQLYLPLPDNRGLRRIADELTRAPGDRASIAEWARRVAMSERSLARMVRRETGMTFGQWRQQLQIIIALQQLSAGVSVQRTAEILGYESVSSFIGMFRKALGSPPGPLRARQHAAASRLNGGRRKGLAVRQLFSPEAGTRRHFWE